jgi:hypothetical protein
MRTLSKATAIPQLKTRYVVGMEYEQVALVLNMLFSWSPAFFDPLTRITGGE